MFVLRKIWRALFSLNARFAIRPFALLPRLIPLLGCNTTTKYRVSNRADIDSTSSFEYLMSNYPY